MVYISPVVPSHILGVAIMNIRDISTLLNIHHLVVLAVEKDMPLDTLISIQLNQPGVTPDEITQLYFCTESIESQKRCQTALDLVITRQLASGEADTDFLESVAREYPCSPEVLERCSELLDQGIIEELDSGTVTPARADELLDNAYSTQVVLRCQTLADTPYLQALQDQNPLSIERIVSIFEHAWTEEVRAIAIKRLLAQGE